jgi:hypothetical protein
MRAMVRWFPVAAVALVVALPASWSALALAEQGDGEPSTATLFTDGAKALQEGRPADAIAEFEALADRGVVDPVASYDRGLAYALRVRSGAEDPGDLGRAVEGFEEARDLSHDGRLIDDASKALILVRSEIARRRTRAGESVEVDPGRSLGRSLAALLSEDTWAMLCILASVVMSLALAARWLGLEPRLRVSSGIVLGIAAPLLVLSVVMTLAARHDRLTLREAVVVAASARAVDDRGIVVAGGSALPEGARVEVLDTHGSQARVRFGTTEQWINAATLREIARRQ